MSALPNVLTADPRDFDRETVDWMVDELQARLGEVGVAADMEVARIKSVLRCHTAPAKALRALSERGFLTGYGVVSVSSARPVDELTVARGESAPTLAAVTICKARAALKPFGMKIETVWGQGYEAPPETRAFLKSIMSGDVPKD